MNRELEVEAQSYLDRNYNLSYKRTTWQKLHEKTFIAGATSKYVEKQKLKFAIEELKNVDFNMCKLLRNEAINLDLTQEEATYKWERTKWHLEIIDKIKELEKQLKELKSKSI